jgi:hypothetical protein
MSNLEKVDLCSKLMTIINHKRHSIAIFAILIVILTPLFLTMAVIVLLLALTFVDLPVIDYIGYNFSFITGANLALAFMFISYFIRPKPAYLRRGYDALWLILGLIMLCALFAFSYCTSFADTHSFFFWSVYLVLAFATMVCIGHAYEPNEDYYLGWRVGPFLIDDPQTLEDDIDRAHFSLGFTLALPSFIVESYVAIFGSTWLWRRLDERELRSVVALLKKLDANDDSGARDLIQMLSPGSALRVIRSLVKLEMITIKKGFLGISIKGREFLYSEDSF